MTSHVFVIFSIVSVYVEGSLYQDGGLGCEISSGLASAGELNLTLSAVDTCSTGVISWHYPTGTLSISFPRTVLPDLGNPRKSMKVCFRGGIGQGVSSIKQKIYRRFRVVTHAMKLDGYEWVCTRPSKQSHGILVILLSDSQESPQFYLKAIHYRAVVVNASHGRHRRCRQGNIRRCRKRDTGRGQRQ